MKISSEELIKMSNKVIADAQRCIAESNIIMFDYLARESKIQSEEKQSNSDKYGSLISLSILWESVN